MFPNSPSASDFDNPEPDEPQTAKVRTLTNAEDAYACSLVLSAADIPHRIDWFNKSHQELYVPISQLTAAHEELAAYEHESLHWPQLLKQQPDSTATMFKAMSVMVAGLLLWFYGVTGQWQQDSVWFHYGAGDSQAILEAGQYFRLVTALTLHADLVHVLSNCLLGGFVLHYLLQLTGNGIGLAAVLLASTLANYVNVLAHGLGHHFVGFSTAVFVVVGMLCTMNFINHRRPLVGLMMPVMSGLALLAMLGASGERTDLGAHLFGLLCGLAAGNLARLELYKRWKKSVPLQTSLVLCSGLAVYGCWLLARQHQ